MRTDLPDLPAPRDLLVTFLGTQPYDPVRALQQSLAQAVRRNLCGELVLALEHEPVITLGKRAKDGNVIASREWLAQQGIALCETERGGDVTYHGPGQLVVYPIFRVGRAVRTHVTALARATAETLADLGIDAVWDDHRPGLWVDSDKIAAVGVAVQGGVAFHGLALNVSVDLSGFSAIVPCGLTDAGVTSIERLLGQSPSTATLAQRLIARLAALTSRPSPHFFPPSQLFSHLTSLGVPGIRRISLNFPR